MIVEANKPKYVLVMGNYKVGEAPSIEFTNKNNVTQTLHTGRIRSTFAEFFVPETLLVSANLPAKAKFKVGNRIVKEETFELPSESVAITDLSTQVAGLETQVSTTEDLIESKIKLVGRVRNVGGYKAPASKCPITKAAVSVINGGFDGYDGQSNIYKVQQVPDFAEANFSLANLYQVTSANVNWYCIGTGPWNQGAASGLGTNTKPMDITTMVEGQFFSIAYGFLAGLYSPDVRIWIDDEEIADWYLGTRAAGTLQGKSVINTAGLGSGIHVININFPKRGLYKVRIAGIINTLGGATVNANTVGNLITINANMRLLKPAPRVKVGVISDSFFEPIVTQTTLTMASEIGHQLGAQIYNFAQSGSGMVNPSGGGANGDKSYPSTLVQQALARQPKMDIMIVHGSANDLGYTEAQNIAGMKATFDMLRAYSPKIPIVWVGIEPQSYFKGVYTLPFMKARENALLAVANADPNVILTIPTCNEEWLTGTGKVGGVANNGNQDWVTGADGVHLSAYGTEFYGKMIAERMKSAILGGI